MGRAGRTVYPTRAYRDDRARVLAGAPLCVHCGRRPGTEADHQPPLSCHVHVAGSGCCRLVPSCFRCGRRQGALLVNGYRPRKRPAPPFAKMPDVTATATTDVAAAAPAGFDVADPVWDVAWLTELRDVPADAVWPRLMSAPHPAAVGSYGCEVTLADGAPLRWFQRLWMVRLLEHDADGRLCWNEALVTLARQVGKSWGVAGLAWWRLHQRERFGEPQEVLHTGKDVAICREVQRPARILAKRDRDTYKVREVNGQEEIEVLADGSRWRVRANDSVYGYTAGLAVVDEAWKLIPAVVDEGLAPTMAERISPQLLLVSTAHRRATRLVLDRRATALDDLSGGDVLLLEWSAPADADVDDVAAWRCASPHWTRERERLIGRQLAAARAGEATGDPDEIDPLEGFRTQWLNIWPATAARSGRGEPLVDQMAWAACEGTLGVDGPGWVAVEQNHNGAAAVAFVACDGDRYEIDGRALDTFADALALAARFIAQRPGSRLLVGANMASTVRTDWKHCPEFRTVGPSETPRALPLFRSLVAAGRIVHDATADLDHQIDRARVRPTANGMLMFHDSAKYHRADLLRAAIWAMHAAYTPPPNPQIH